MRPVSCTAPIVGAEKHSLFVAASERIVALFEFDPVNDARVLNMLVKHTDDIPVEMVVNQLTEAVRLCACVSVLVGEKGRGGGNRVFIRVPTFFCTTHTRTDTRTPMHTRSHPPIHIFFFFWAGSRGEAVSAPVLGRAV